MQKTSRFPKMSPKRLARVTGVFYLITIVAAVIAQGVIAQRLVNSTDASVTAANIMAHPDLFIGWLSFLWPPLGYRINLYVAAVGLLGSLATIGWLIVVGVNESRWVQRISFAPN